MVVVRQELEKASTELPVCMVIQVGLQRDMGQVGHQQRDQQAQDFVLQEFSKAAFPCGVEQAGPRDGEHQWHHKGTGE